MDNVTRFDAHLSPMHGNGKNLTHLQRILLFKDSNENPDIA
jgi:hypothetical protein